MPFSFKYLHRVLLTMVIGITLLNVLPTMAFAEEALKPNITSKPTLDSSDSDLHEDPLVDDSNESTVPQQGLYIEFLNYEEYVYSRSRKTEIGDQLELDMALRYQFSPSTFGRFRFLTDPVENRFNNKTSKFEFLAGHVYNDFFFQFDTELLTNDGDSGGTSIGMDLDSEDTLIAYQFANGFLLSFFPFNFDGEVGHEFNTWDVTRIYFIDGSPTTIQKDPAGEEKIAEKTLGGFQLTWKASPQKNEGLVLGAGVGAATYEYPGNNSYNIEVESSASTRWERREDIGYKAFINYRVPRFRFEGKYVGHNKAHETGSLLQSAASLYSIYDMDNFDQIGLGHFVIEAEATMSKAGDAPYRLNSSGEWFESTTPWQPVYKDIAGQKQSWIGKTDYAYALKAGMRFGNVTPYLSYRYQGEDFVFRERESAHMLRTNNESESHGGLNRMGIGAYINSGNFVLNPEFEYLVAENPVFSSAGDVRNDRQNAKFVKEDFLVYLIVRYQFDGPKLFQP